MEIYQIAVLVLIRRTGTLRQRILNQINPKGMPTLFLRLKTDHDAFIPEFLSTHPITDDRIQNIKGAIKHKKYKTVNNKKLQDLFNRLKKNQ